MEDPRIQVFLEQLETLWLLLVRPVVQQQLLLFLVVTLVAWLIPIPYRFFVRRLERRFGVAAIEAGLEAGQPVPWRVRVVRVLRGLEYLLFPMFGLVLGGLAVAYMRGNGMPYGLLERLLRLFWLLLAYRVILAILYGTLKPETARPYHRRFVAPVFAVLFAASLTIGLAGAFPLGELELFEFMGQALSLRSIATAAAVLYLTFAFAWISRDVLSRYLIPRTQADPGVAHAIELVAHYSIIGIGIFMAASALGFDLTALLVIFGGLSVGIGFGLQELVANFISGILLVFEQTLRPGDIVEVEGQRGTVTHMRMRATVLRNIDNIELFVPNKTLLTSNVAAYTLSDRTVRRTISVGVSYDSDPRQVRDILKDIADRHELVLKDPEPTVFFTEFGDSSLKFELGVWIGDPMRALFVLSDLHFMIFSDFAKHGIKIPFPQRDINFPTQPPATLHISSPTHAPSGKDRDGADKSESDSPADQPQRDVSKAPGEGPLDPARLP